MELSSSNIKKVLTFSQIKAFTIYQEMEAPKNSLYLELCHSSGNENTQKLLISQEVTFRAQKIKKITLKIFFIFLGLKIYSPKKLNKTFLYS